MIKAGVTTKLCGTLEERVGALFELAHWQPQEPAMSTLVDHLVSREARVLLRLVKENTLVLREPFRAFTQGLAELLSPAASHRGLRIIRDIKALFAGYRRNPANFVSQRTRVVTCPLDGHALACVCAGPDSLLIVSTKVRPFLVNYDLSTNQPATRDRVLRTYFELLASRGPLQLCLVRKKYGPKGPIRFREELAAEGPQNLLVYSQDRHAITEGTLDPEFPVLIAYDLIASGVGIRAIMQDVREALHRRGNPEPTVWAHVLYAYSDSKEEAGVEVLHHGTPSEDERILSLAPRGLGQSATPFENTQLEDVDPLCRLPASMARDLAFARSSSVFSEHAGRWIAVRDENVVAWADSWEAVRAKVGPGNSNVVIEYVDDLSREY